MKKLFLVCFVLLATASFAHAKVTGDKLPKVTNLNSIITKISYPDDAKNQSIEGRVTAKLLVNENGVVEEVSRNDFKGPSVFFDEVEKVVWSLEFEPATENDVPVKSWVEVPFNFKLPKKEPMKSK
ncbi:MAG: TonB family protein [Ignavibacteriae bacterium]|nr:TonB family protein [Ignavibacteriota bacterium]